MTGIVLKRYGLQEMDCKIIPLKSGLINATWKVETNEKSYILQRINNEVFKNPYDIDANISSIAAFLHSHSHGYLFTAPVLADNGKGMLDIPGEGYYRMFDFIEGTHTKDTIKTADAAYEGARQFGKFTAELKRFDCSALKYTIPGFHDISFRYSQFLHALEHGNPDRLHESKNLIAQMKEHAGIVDQYERIKLNPSFRLRVTHHDTKISNVLFDENNKGVCVIDLDTVMPGYFISDIGDMIRTYVCPVSEEEKDTSKIQVRQDVYAAIVNGYLAEMGQELSEQEKNHFAYAGEFLIYMQALRFITDYLMNDVYYAISYPQQNYTRAINQAVLLERFIAMSKSSSGFM